MTQTEGGAAAGAPEGLDRLREELDRVDGTILAALAERHRLIEETARVKAAGADFLRDPAREEALLARLRERARTLGLDGFWVTGLFRQIVEHSVRFQPALLRSARRAGRRRAHGQRARILWPRGAAPLRAAAGHGGGDVPDSAERLT
jgi:chorismate mutase